MIDFDLAIPTKLYFGKNKEELVGEILKERNAQKVLVVIGQGSVRKSGLLDKVLLALQKEDIEYQIFEGVRANPTREFANKGVELAKSYNPDYLLAIGGGSVIDTAKYMAVGYYYDGDAFDFNLHKKKPAKALPIGTILTIAAAGSEMSTSCVIQDDDIATKIGFNSDLVRPNFAIENPLLTFSVNKAQTAFGITDILMHTLERYLQPSCNNEPADRFAEGLMKSVIEAGKAVMKNPNDYEARATLMLMSSWSHNGLTSIGKSFGMPVHQLEHPLSGLYPEVAHGEGLAILWPSWARYYLPYEVDKFNSLAVNVFDLHDEDKYKNASKGIDMMQEFFISLGISSKLTALHTNKQISIDDLVETFSQGGTRVVAHHAKPMDQKIAREIYTNCF